MRQTRSILVILVLTLFGLMLLSGCSKSPDPQQNMTPEQKEQDDKRRKEKQGSE